MPIKVVELFAGVGGFRIGLEGYPREEGVFATEPNYLYKISTDSIPLIPEEEIELRVEGIFEDRAVTSTAFVLKPPFLTFPMDGGNISFEPGKKINIGWTPVGEGELYSFSFLFDISEPVSFGSAFVLKETVTRY